MFPSVIMKGLVIFRHQVESEEYCLSAEATLALNSLEFRAGSALTKFKTKSWKAPTDPK